jgi:probable rRNA maturation factor
MTPSVDLDILIDVPGWTTAFDDVEGLCLSAVNAAMATTPDGGRGHAVNVLLTNDQTMRRLNRTYRGQDKATNVLSFPAAGTNGGGASPGGEPPWLGDLALGLEAAVREAEDEGKPLADHVCHLIVHGTLHLLGYDHEDDAAASIMERLETRVLAGLGVPDPYQSNGA